MKGVILLLAALLLAVFWQPQKVEHIVLSLIGKAAQNPGSPAQIYRWTDANGAQHYSDTPPPGIEYQTLETPTSSNLIPAYQPRPQPRDSAKNSAPQPAFTAQPLNAANTLREARKLQGIVDARDEEMRRVID